MVEVGKKIRATLLNGKVVEGPVKSIHPLYEGGEVGGPSNPFAGFLKKLIGTRYIVECPTCGHETPVDVCSTLEVIDESL